MDIVCREIPGAPFRQTVDTLKSGSPTNPVTGIVTTMFPTVEVIEESAKTGANMIIAHEPTFYNHTDDPDWVHQNTVVDRKKQILESHNITVWRFHDYWHSYKPDGIRQGVLKATGWLPYAPEGKAVLQLPPTRLAEIASHLKESLGIRHLRMIGEPDQVCRKVVLLPGSAGGQVQVSFCEKEKPDLLIVGELQEWETAEYIRDARLTGTDISLLVLGHALSEEAGMAWLRDWLEPRFPELKIRHIASGDPFSWI